MTTTAPVQASIAARETRKFTVAEYFRLVDAGIIQPGERVELVEGEILTMPPMGNSHFSGIMRYTRVFGRLAGERFALLVQAPLPLDERSAPEPDLALLTFREDDYASRRPGPADALLVVEVADSSLDYDRGVKARIYGRAGVPETWALNLPEDCIERFTGPGPEGYGQHDILRRGEKVSPAALPDLELAVEDLLLPLAPAE